ncbi:tRNA (uridine(34)/cytosine(34)/5-carboxymethylaminomethyluridine(34)-2'-O)-methyltransferase TrmL [Clostridium cylindrosporum]|uniref:Putative tRNA (cytidine(34)-2'-O)-methyltransferase n=1 Tax=Clostridium cylindrosporum DSM 605 TaxID=1121307 RepID=A0A0J8D8Y3_CLOCY|nr:tRNA (uridine(34)/cytosine(34)/5-carboxymethylaminomethyluridine(34)-2'-O)-methyltransferase TrmL [Clostridium cylindrosporum]KMT20814.1 putative tRNA (cytidine(34)-2'-O)-methyltransferase CspR [Clostridium cylindrosporum DSM 605]
MSLNIVLYQPEIPHNTGSIGRTCVLTDTKLHLIKPLGFSVDDKMLKRAGLDYWKDIDITYYESFDEFYEAHRDKRIFLSTTKATKFHSDVEYKDGDFIMFGRESSGVTEEINNLFKETQIRVPMINSTTRSLNLANTASLVVYEALRQIGYPNMK